MKNINLVFPHQLFEENPLLDVQGHYYLIEESLFFNQYAFHKIKIAYHRASMKFYEQYLLDSHKKVNYINSQDQNADIRNFIADLPKSVENITCIYPSDNWLQKRLEEACDKKGIQLEYIWDSPMFLEPKPQELDFFRSSKVSFHQTSYYKQQRKKRNVLLDENGKPQGGKWTFDKENRKKYPKGKTPPSIQFPDTNEWVKEAKGYTVKNFANNPGTLPESWFYPISFKDSKSWLEQFLDQRFHLFGDYEDAIVQNQHFLHHSVLTPMLNAGLITPETIISESITYAKEHDVPINSLEGFIRQIIGWREFIHGIYEVKGSYERTRNFWGFSNSIPNSFYDGTTGIQPVDDAIKKVLQTGYSHHIERLMILANFFLLCEIDPDEVYRWFMEMYVDSYDWVMVPNVYGMSQFADGGLMSTKPYISSSNYIKKMSDYKKGDWENIWDALFWRFMDKQRDFFSSNPRMNMLLSNWDKKDNSEREKMLKTANDFLQELHSNK